jgi:hypothetical protein
VVMTGYERDGRELFYRTGDDLMSVPYRTPSTPGSESITAV